MGSGSGHETEAERLVRLEKSEADLINRLRSVRHTMQALRTKIGADAAKMGEAQVSDVKAVSV